MFYPISINILKTNYFEWITKSAPKKIDKFFEKIDDEDCVEGYLIKLPNSHPSYYDELWLLDINDNTGLAPVLIQNINVSSYHALWCCNFEDDEETETKWNLDELIDVVGGGWKKGLRKVMEEEYINKKINKKDSVEDIFNSLN